MRDAKPSQSLAVTHLRLFISHTLRHKGTIESSLIREQRWPSVARLQPPAVGAARSTMVSLATIGLL